MFEKMKKLGITFIVLAVLSIAVWVLFFCLRFIVFQHSVTLKEGTITHLMNIRSIYKNFYYFDEWPEAVWKLFGWFATCYSVGMAILLAIEGVKKLNPKFFILAVISLIGVVPILDFCASSGEYFRYLQKFLGENYFYFFGIVGFLVYGAIVTGFIAAVCAFGLWGNDKDPAPEIAVVTK